MVIFSESRESLGPGVGSLWMSAMASSRPWLSLIGLMLCKVIFRGKKKAWKKLFFDFWGPSDFLRIIYIYMYICVILANIKSSVSRSLAWVRYTALIDWHFIFIEWYQRTTDSPKVYAHLSAKTSVERNWRSGCHFRRLPKLYKC